MSHRGWKGLVCALVLIAPVAIAQTIDSESELLAALGQEGPDVTFDEFDPGTCFDSSGECASLDGVSFFSPNVGASSYSQIETTDGSSGTASPPNVLGGGTEFDSFPGTQVIDIVFDPPVDAAGFFLTDLDYQGFCAVYPSTATILVDYAAFGDDVGFDASFEVSGDGNPQTPEFFGLAALEASAGIGTLRIVAGTITETDFSCLDRQSIRGSSPELVEYGIDNLSYGDLPVVVFPDAPRCNRVFVPGTSTEIVQGAAEAVGETFLDSVELIGGNNVTLTVFDFESGDSTVSFEVEVDDEFERGSGVVVVTASNEESCELGVDLRPLPPGPTLNEQICAAGGISLQVTNLGNTPAGTLACGSTQLNENEPSLPPGYVPSPAGDPFPCTVLTIDSPIVDDTEMTYKKDGVFDPRLRLLFSEFDENLGVFPDFEDITEQIAEIPNIVPDPTQLIGRRKWTPVKIACALLDPDCVGVQLGLDEDLDGFPLCTLRGVPLDCSDQNPLINPDGVEICNGLDDDCDGTIDEGFFGGDGDRFADCVDNCPFDDNDDQSDIDNDGIGDVCDNATPLLGSIDPQPGFDTDLYAFFGTAGEQVSLTLDRFGLSNDGERVGLALFSLHPPRLLGARIGRIPSEIGRTLPRNGIYFVLVVETPSNRNLRRFTGAYSITLESEGGAPATFVEIPIPDLFGGGNAAPGATQIEMN